MASEEANSSTAVQAPQQDAFDTALAQLLDISEKVVDGSKLKKRDKIVKSFRLYRIALKYNNKEEFVPSIAEVRKSITLRWSHGATLHSVLLNNDYQFEWENDGDAEGKDPENVMFYISRIYKIAQDYKDETKTHLTDEKKSYPDLMLLYFAKIMNYVEKDSRLEETISHLESIVTVADDTKQRFTQMFERFSKGQGNGFMEKINQTGKKLMNSGAMEKMMSGDIRSAIQSIATPEMKKDITENFAPIVDPFLPKVAGMFKKNGLTGDGFNIDENITLEKVFDSAMAAAHAENGPLDKLESDEAKNMFSGIGDAFSGKADLGTVIDKMATTFVQHAKDDAGSAGPAPPTPPEGYKLSEDYDLYDASFLKRYSEKLKEKATDPRFVSVESGQKDYPLKL